MPRKETVISVFVASPSDVGEERKSLESIIYELNKTWSKNLNLRLDLIKWESDVHPNFGAYPQDVINTQINDQYDVFVAIFWGKIGSPTKSYQSGTLEELNRAHEKYLRDNSSVDIMVYFKDQAIPPSKMDYEQLKGIDELKQKLGHAGGLYWVFDRVENFESLLRGHLSMVAQKWSHKLSESDKNDGEIYEKNSQLPEDKKGVFFDDNYGILDYIEIYEDRMSNMTSALNQMADATQKIG